MDWLHHLWKTFSQATIIPAPSARGMQTNITKDKIWYHPMPISLMISGKRCEVNSFAPWLLDRTSKVTCDPGEVCTIPNVTHLRKIWEVSRKCDPIEKGKGKRVFPRESHARQTKETAVEIDEVTMRFDGNTVTAVLVFSRRLRSLLPD